MGNLFWCNTVCCVFLLLQTRKNRGISPVFRLFAFDFRYHVRVSSSFLTPFASHRCAYGDTLDISMYNSFFKSVVTFLEGLFICCPGLFCAVPRNLYGGYYGKFCCDFDSRPAFLRPCAAHGTAHPLVLEAEHQLRLRISLPMAAQFRRHLYGAILPRQCRDRGHCRFSGTSWNWCAGIGTIFPLDRKWHRLRRCHLHISDYSKLVPSMESWSMPSTLQMVGAISRMLWSQVSCAARPG